jgi:predicted PurR-regulated permease PerM
VPGLELPAGSHGQVLDLEARRKRRVVRWVVVGVGVAGLLALGFYLSEVFNPLLIGLLLAYMLNPLVEWAERRGWSRDRFVTLLFVVVFLVTSVLLGIGAVKMVGQVERLGRALAGERVLDPEDFEDRFLIDAAVALRDGKPLPTGATRERIVHLATAEGHWFIDRDGDGERDPGLVEKVVTVVYGQLGDSVSRHELQQFAGAARNHASSLTRAGSQVTGWLREVANRAGAFLQYLLLVPLYTFFLLQSFSNLRDQLRDHLPGTYRARVVQIARRIDRQVAAFFRGKLMLALGKGTVTWLGFWIAGIPFAFPIGMGAGLLSVVPFLGPICGGGLAIIVSFAPTGWLLKIVLVLVVLAVAEAVEAVAQPVILGREVGLSPLTLILSFFVFGQLFGLFGVLLAVPIACAANTLFVELLLPEIKALAREPGPSIPPETQVFKALSEEQTTGEAVAADDSASPSEPPADA